MPNPKSSFRPISIKFIKWMGLLAFLFFVYVVASLIYATFTDYQPEAVITLPIGGKARQAQIVDSTLSIISWNIGYSGLGAESDFFYSGSGYLMSGNKMVRSPKKSVEKNVSGAMATMQQQQADIYLLQEVDVASKRSYYINQQAAIQQLLPAYASTMAINFNVQRIPTPILEPWAVYGRAYSGLGTFSAIQPLEAKRYQLPGTFHWPNRLFLLDRCLAVHRYATSWGKELVVINLHNSAFDRKGDIKAQQMDFLKTLLSEEYEKGNYVVVGGDWNQCPPLFPYDTFSPNSRKYAYNPNIDPEFMPEGWQWLFDPKTPTNRSTVTKFLKKKSFQTIIDYFLISPNITALETTCIDQQFEYSDHQAVKVKLQLN